jgi:hypothetical protein
MALMERERLARHRDDLTDQIEELRRFKHVPAAAPAPAPAPVLSPLAHIADELDRLKARMTSSAMVSAPQPANRRGSGYSSPQAYPTAKPPVHNNAPTKLAAMVPRYPPVSNITPPASSFPAGGEPPVRPSTNDQYLYVHASAASVLPDGTLVIRANAVQQNQQQAPAPEPVAPPPSEPRVSFLPLPTDPSSPSKATISLPSHKKGPATEEAAIESLLQLPPDVLESQGVQRHLQKLLDIRDNRLELEKLHQERELSKLRSEVRTNPTNILFSLWFSQHCFILHILLFCRLNAKETN